MTVMISADGATAQAPGFSAGFLFTDSIILQRQLSYILMHLMSQLKAAPTGHLQDNMLKS